MHSEGIPPFRLRCGEGVTMKYLLVLLCWAALANATERVDCLSSELIYRTLRFELNQKSIALVPKRFNVLPQSNWDYVLVRQGRAVGGLRLFEQKNFRDLRFEWVDVSGNLLASSSEQSVDCGDDGELCSVQENAIRQEKDRWERSMRIINLHASQWFLGTDEVDKSGWESWVREGFRELVNYFSSTSLETPLGKAGDWKEKVQRQLLSHPELLPFLEEISMAKESSNIVVVRGMVPSNHVFQLVVSAVRAEGLWPDMRTVIDTGMDVKAPQGCQLFR